MFEIEKYKFTIDSFHTELLNTEPEETGIRLSDEKWSLKDIIGHLIDSASNNHQRFVRLQFGDLLDFPAYKGEEWLKAQNYQMLDWNTLIDLWRNYNYLILNVINNMNQTSLENVWVVGEETITLEELVIDYYKHLGIHIEHFRKRVADIEGK
ncbi:MAG: DinB family protein [Bacillota bacterium]|nr:DinB family protein [Bacillota bacterium]